MMTQEAVELVIQEARDNIATLRDFAETEIPASLSDAAETGIDIAIRGAEAALLIRYDQDLRKMDRQRVITLRNALEILAQFEEAVMLEQIEGGVSRLWNFFTSTYQGIVAVVTGLWEAVLALQDERVRDIIWRFFVQILRNIVQVTAVAIVQKPLREILATRARFEVQMRRKALPQRTTPRVYRRKRAR